MLKVPVVHQKKFQAPFLALPWVLPAVNNKWEQFEFKYSPFIVVGKILWLNKRWGLYHFLVLLDIQSSLVHEVLFSLGVRFLLPSLRQRFRCGPLPVRPLRRKSQGNLQDVWSSASSWRFYTLRWEKERTRLKDSTKILLKRRCECKSYYFLHLPADHVLLKTTAGVLLWGDSRHLGLLRSPPRRSQAASLSNIRPGCISHKQSAGKQMSSNYLLGWYRIGEASIRAKAVAAVVWGRGGGLHWNQRDTTEAP